MVVSVIEIE